MDGLEAYKKWHWGNEATDVEEIAPPSVVKNPNDIKKWDDMNLVECGRAYEIHFSPFSRSPKRSDTIIRLNRKQSEDSHLCFDMDHPSHRLYFVLCPSALKRIKNDFYKVKNPDSDLMPLKELAEYAGGRHATDDYEDIMVKPLGILTNVVYATDKKGDGFSYYIHKMGEESGIRPALGVASDGSLWFAGGNYTSPVQGITD